MITYRLNKLHILHWRFGLTVSVYQHKTDKEPRGRCKGRVMQLSGCVGNACSNLKLLQLCKLCQLGRSVTDDRNWEDEQSSHFLLLLVSSNICRIIYSPCRGFCSFLNTWLFQPPTSVSTSSHYWVGWLTEVNYYNTPLLCYSKDLSEEWIDALLRDKRKIHF